MKYAGFFGGDEPPASCEEMEFGEVEDYCVEITDNIIGITEQGAVSWNLYPNPANDVVYITLPLGVHRLEVFDLTGRMVEQTTTQGNLELSFADQPEGVYLVRLTTAGGEQSTRRVIIARQQSISLNKKGCIEMMRPFFMCPLSQKQSGTTFVIPLSFSV